MKIVYVLIVVFATSGSEPRVLEQEYPNLVECIDTMYNIQFGHTWVGQDIIDMKCIKRQIQE